MVTGYAGTTSGTCSVRRYGGARGLSRCTVWRPPGSHGEHAGGRPWLWGVIALLASLGLGPGHLRAAELRAAEPAPRYEELVTGGAEPDARLPMIVVLHGRGGGRGGGGASEELHGYRGGHEPDAAVVRDVRRRVAAEARRLHASPGCAR